MSRHEESQGSLRAMVINKSAIVSRLPRTSLS